MSAPTTMTKAFVKTAATAFAIATFATVAHAQDTGQETTGSSAGQAAGQSGGEAAQAAPGTGDRGLVLTPAPSNGSDSSGVANGNNNGAYGGLVLTPNDNGTPTNSSDGTALGGLTLSNGQPLSPAAQLAKVANDPNATYDQLYNAVSNYWSSNPDPAKPPPVVVPAGDTDAKNAVQELNDRNNQMNQANMNQAEQALAYAHNLPPGPQRDAAIQAANNLDRALSQNTADYVYANEMKQSADFVNQGKYGWAMVLTGPAPQSGYAQSQVAPTQAAYNSSSQQVDAAWAAFEQATGTDRQTVMATPRTTSTSTSNLINSNTDTSSSQPQLCGQ